eukprot:scaffold267413_cov31-Tisochrysis_lutea.AAC.5
MLAELALQTDDARLGDASCSPQLRHFMLGGDSLSGGEARRLSEADLQPCDLLRAPLHLRALLRDPPAERSDPLTLKARLPCVSKWKVVRERGC